MRLGLRRGRALAGAVQWLVTAATVAALGWVVWSKHQDLSRVFVLDLTTFALMSVSAIATFLVNGVELQVLVAKFGTRIRLAETMRLGLMVSTLNYLPMKTGTMLLGVVMKARHAVQLPDFAALVAGSSVVHLWVACTLAGLFRAFDGYHDALSLGLLVVPTAVLAGFVVWGRLRADAPDRSHMRRLTRMLLRAMDGLGMIFADPMLVTKEIVINALLVALASWRTFLAFHALSAPVGWDQAVVITAVAIFAARLSVIPGGLGFREGGAFAGAVMVGVAPSLGLETAVIDRAVNLVWLVLLGIPATLYVQRETGLHLRLSLEGGEVTGEDQDVVGTVPKPADEVVAPEKAD